MLEPSDRRLVVSDLHGDWPNLLGLLRAVGALDAAGERRPGWWLVQLGDLIHGGHDEVRDGRCLEEGLRLFDVCLLGNHELPHAFPAAGFARFAGQTPLAPAVAARLRTAAAAGRFQAAAAIDGWLLSHGGLHPALAAGVPTDAAACAAAINAWFGARTTTFVHRAIFDAVGPARGGRDPVGGIFWLDWDELTAAAATPWPQIVGHSPRPDAPLAADGRLWCVDVGAALSGRVAALRKDGADDDWHPIVYPAG